MMPDEVFEIGQIYTNRLGPYKVLAINGDRMQLRYEGDGREDTLTIEDQRRIIANMSQEEYMAPPQEKRTVPQIADSRQSFFSFIDVCNRLYRSGHDLYLYRQIIDKHRNGNGLDSLLKDEDFYPLIWNTLDAWNMNQRRAKLTSIDNLRSSILVNRFNLLELYQYKLHSISAGEVESKVIRSLKQVFVGLNVMESKRRIVGVSKTLHFLLPDLVMPIDGKYTLSFFYGYNKSSTDVEADYNTFEEIFRWTRKVTSKLGLNQDDVNNVAWNTSVPKLIDDAIIGWKHMKDNQQVGGKDETGSDESRAR